jgi:PRTRC genetic system protein A
MQPDLNLRDQILQRACPTVMVPRFEKLELLQEPGHRYLTASDGLWIEIMRPWLHLVLPVALQSVVAMPYGLLEPTVAFSFKTIPYELFRNFVDDARLALPNEFAAWFTWNSRNHQFAYRPISATSASRAYLSFERPVLDDDEHLVVDIHSHASMKAFFSSEDNRDDAGEVKLSVVVGHLGEGQKMQSKLRLCANGLKIPAADIDLLSNLEIGGHNSTIEETVSFR